MYYKFLSSFNIYIKNNNLKEYYKKIKLHRIIYRLNKYTSI